MKDERQVGTTFGLADFRRESDDAEQVYVLATGDKKRPVAVEAHQGWGVKAERHRLVLTRRQAAELAMLLVASLCEGASPNVMD